MPIDPNWFTQRLQERELSQRGLARLMGMDPGAVSLMLRGKRKMTLDEAAEIAVILDVTTQDVLVAAGIEIRSKERVKVVGYMRAGGVVTRHAKGLHETTDGHSSLPPETVAVQCRTHGSAIEHMDGWMLFISGSNIPLANIIGMTALAGVRGNGEVIGYIKRGYKKGSYNIAGMCGEVHSNVELAWASPVLWIRTNS